MTLGNIRKEIGRFGRRGSEHTTLCRTDPN